MAWHKELTIFREVLRVRQLQDSQCDQALPVLQASNRIELEDQLETAKDSKSVLAVQAHTTKATRNNFQAKGSNNNIFHRQPIQVTCETTWEVVYKPLAFKARHQFLSRSE